MMQQHSEEKDPMQLLYHAAYLNEKGASLMKNGNQHEAFETFIEAVESVNTLSQLVEAKQQRQRQQQRRRHLQQQRFVIDSQKYNHYEQQQQLEHRTLSSLPSIRRRNKQQQCNNRRHNNNNKTTASSSSSSVVSSRRTRRSLFSASSSSSCIISNDECFEDGNERQHHQQQQGDVSHNDVDEASSRNGSSSRRRRGYHSDTNNTNDNAGCVGGVDNQSDDPSATFVYNQAFRFTPPPLRDLMMMVEYDDDYDEGDYVNVNDDDNEKDERLVHYIKLYRAILTFNSALTFHQRCHGKAATLLAASVKRTAESVATNLYLDAIHLLQDCYSTLDSCRVLAATMNNVTMLFYDTNEYIKFTTFQKELHRILVDIETKFPTIKTNIQHPKCLRCLFFNATLLATPKTAGAA